MKINIFIYFILFCINTSTLAASELDTKTHIEYSNIEIESEC